MEVSLYLDLWNLPEKACVLYFSDSQPELPVPEGILLQYFERL